MLNIRAWIHCENMIDLLDPRVDMDRILNRILKVSFSFLKIKRKIKQMLNIQAWIHRENMKDLEPRVDMDRILNRILKVFSF